MTPFDLAVHMYVQLLYTQEQTIIILTIMKLKMRFANNYQKSKNSWKITLKFFQLDINELKNESFVHSLQICLENKWWFVLIGHGAFPNSQCA